MTNVALAENNGRFTARIHGHADYGPHGADIVCAAVSMLSQTLMQAVLDAPSGTVARVDAFAVDGGNVVLDMTVTDSGCGYMCSVFSAIMGGFKLLEKKYPECVAVGRNRQDEFGMVFVQEG